MMTSFKEEIEHKQKLKELALAEYKIDMENKNNFSYWFNKIKNVEYFIVPKSYIVPIPFDIWLPFAFDCIDEYYQDIVKFTNENLVPILVQKGISAYHFVKNGRFSNKFSSYHNCITNSNMILESFINICYGASCVGAGGNTEFIIRDYINYDVQKYATIYTGLPLRCEIRVFYDFDKRKVLYSVNYWDSDYVSPHLYDRTDQIIFSAVKDELQENYEKYKNEVCDRIEKAFKDIHLTGQWSIDIMIDESFNKFKMFLIDMAIAQNSAYWNMAKAEASLEAIKCIA